MSVDVELTHARTALRAALPDEPGFVSASRVRTPGLAALLPDMAVESLPVVWGRTLWSQASGSCVVEQPNGLGIVETGFPDHAVVVTTLGTPQVMRRDDVGRGVPPGTASLRGRLLQLRGVDSATRRFDSGRFVLLFPCDPHRVASVPTPNGLTATVLDPHLAEYAGGVRFDVTGELVESELIAYAAVMADRLGQVEGLT